MSVIFSTVGSQEDSGGIQFQELDQVLRNAQLRRTADFVDWLRQYLENRRQARLQKHVNLPTTVITQSAG